MKVEIDSGSGFCAGVVNAIGLAERVLGEHGRVFSLGDVVHNRLEMERLEQLGLRTVAHDGLSAMGGERVLIRAHGEPPATYRVAREAGAEIVDATCPVVARLQRTVAAAWRRMTAEGGQVVILGKRGHAEVVGLTGQAETGGEDVAAVAGPTAERMGLHGAQAGAAHVSAVAETSRGSVGGILPPAPPPSAPVIVVEGEGDLAAVDFARPIYLLSQTTQSLDLFGRVSDAILGRAIDPARVTVHDTICRAVADREAQLRDFAVRHDVIVFVSGRKSSNGRVLYDVCRGANPRSHMVEDASELQREWFAGVDSVGVCGATSTPRWAMERVANAVAEY